MKSHAQRNAEHSKRLGGMIKNVVNGTICRCPLCKRQRFALVMGRKLLGKKRAGELRRATLGLLQFADS
jgi:hypothetical protein